MTRLKAYVSNPVERAVDSDLPYVALEHVESATGRLLPGVELVGRDADDSVAHQSGDVRFGKLRPYLSKSILATECGIGSGELLVLRPTQELDSKYLLYITLSRPFVEWAVATSYGVKMPRTSWAALASFDVQLPPIAEQRRVAEHLDQETRRIDDIIGELETLAALVTARRAAEIDDTIEHGGGHEHLVDVDSLWIDSVPFGWKFLPLKRCAERVTVGIVINPSQYYEDSGVPVLRGFNVRPGAVNDRDLAYMSEESNELNSKSKLQNGDVVVVRTGLAGAAAKVPEWAVGGNIVDLLLVRPGFELRPEFLEFVLNSRLVQRQV